MTEIPKKISRVKAVAETVWILLLVCIAFHFLSERIDTRSIPHGDEGSWMSVAAELSKGNGFTTRWLEHGFLKPYTLPRPDDFRYPGLSLVLAAAFRTSGAGYPAGLWTVAVLFLLFGLAVYAVIRAYFGARTACATLPLVYFSLLQLMYSTEVYSEGLFGIGLALLLGANFRFRLPRAAWWPAVGICIGLLYLVRPNAALFSAVFVLFGFFEIFRKGGSRLPAAAGILAMFVVMLPWLTRSWHLFGNPFHLAGSAGLLRMHDSDPLTWSVSDFAGRYGSLFFAKATALNCLAFFRILHEQEHGIEAVPLLFCIAGAVRKRPFYNGMIAWAFLLTLLACFYTSAMGDWAGVRYFSSFLPFVYAYGIAQIFDLADSLWKRIPAVPRMAGSGAVLAAVIALLAAPVYYPHRYYERFYATAAAGRKDFSPYYAALKTQIPDNGFYYAGSLAQINFPLNLNCVGMQFFFDEKEIRRAQMTFNPRLLSLTPAEYEKPYFTGLMNELQKEGFALKPLMMPDSFAVLVKIEKRE